jgi:hypothetical protein
MKKLFLLLLSTTFSVLLMGQYELDNPFTVNDTLIKGQAQHPLSTSINKQARFRSGSTVKELLDSLVAAKKCKYIYSYDSNKNLTKWINYSWSTSSNTWVDSCKGESIYDNNGNETEYIYYKKNNANNSWIASYKREYNYDSNGKRTRYIDLDWDTISNVWVNLCKYEYVYDSTEKVSEYNFYTWKSTTNEWIFSSKNEYRYDSIGNRTQIIDYTWNKTSNTWIVSRKTEYIYDSNRNIISYIHYTLDRKSNTLVYSNKTESVYGNNGKTISSVDYVWDTVSNSWVYSSKSEEAYDDAENFMEIIYYGWNNILDTTIGMIDNKGGFHLLISQGKKDSSDLWINSYKCKCVRDENNYILSWSFFSWDKISNVWASPVTYNYYYTALSAVQLVSASSLKVIAQNGLLVLTGLAEGETLTVYNIQGFAIYNQKATSETISLSLPMHGVYVVKVGSRCVKVVY